MNLSRTTDDRHLYPLLDFLRYLSYHGREGRAEPNLSPDRGGDGGARLPRRFNGSADGLRPREGCLPPAPAPAAPPDEPGDAQPTPGTAAQPAAANERADETHVSGDDEDTGTESVASSVEWEPLPLRVRKRSRVEPTSTVFKKVDTLDCAVVSEFHNGVGNARYFDIPLSEFGALPLVSSPKLRRMDGYKLLSQPCCFLLLGSSLVVTGTVTDTAVDSVQVVPHQNYDLPPKWVNLPSVYKIPQNIDEFQIAVTARYKDAVRQLARSTRSVLD